MDTLCKTTQEQLNDDFSYEIANQIARKMKEDGLISDAQYEELIKLNKESFNPLYKELMS